MKLSNAQFTQPDPTERNHPGLNDLFREIITQRAKPLGSHRVPVVCDRGWRIDQTERRWASFGMNAGAMTAVGQPAAAWCSIAVTRPPSPKAIRTTCVEGDRGQSKRISSARVQTILTGLPTALAASAAGTV